MVSTLDSGSRTRKAWPTLQKAHELPQHGLNFPKGLRSHTRGILGYVGVYRAILGHIRFGVQALELEAVDPKS